MEPLGAPARGAGKTGGPGERQLEIDKRLLKTRLAKARGELREVEQTRGLQRMARQKADVPTVALVGYTNAGKSYTLFNKLVDAGTLMADALFATLDPLMRRMELPGGLMWCWWIRSGLSLTFHTSWLSHSRRHWKK